MNKLIYKLFFFLSFVFVTEDIYACHAMAVQNFNLTVTANGVEVDADSQSPTCGCGAYWLDIEVRCIDENFDGAPFDPTQYLSLSTYPYYQSATMMKPNCVLQAYPTTTVPFTTLCPGVDYQIRVRENNNGNGGPWSTPLLFTVPGVNDPFVGDINASTLGVCLGDCATLDAVVIGGCGLAPTYQWSTGQTSASINVCPTETTTYSVTITEQCTAQQTVESVTIEVLDSIAPGVASVNPTTVCEGETTTLMLDNYAGNIQWQSAPYSTGPWTNIAGATTDSLDSDPINGDICFRAEVSGCGDLEWSNVVCVTTSPTPNVDVSSELICQGESATLVSNVDMPGGTYSWSPTGQTSQNLEDVSPSENTEYELTYDLDGCVVTSTGTVSVNATPEIDVTIDPVCFEEETNFQNYTTIDDINGDVIAGYLWDLGDGTTSTQESLTHEYSDEGTYDVSYYVVSNFGCADSAEYTATVWPLPDVGFSPQDVCLEQENQFYDQTEVSNLYTSNDISVWNWNFGDGNTSNDQNPLHIYDNAGMFNVSLDVTTNNGCSASLTQEVIVHPKPDVNFDTTPIEGCEPLCYDIASTSQVGGGSYIENYKWTYSDGTTFDYGVGDSIHSNCLNNSTSNPILYGLTLEITTDKGCINELNEPNLIEVYHNPVAEFDYSPSQSDILDTEVQFYNNSILADYYEWNIENYGVLNDFSPTITFEQEPEVYNVELMAYTENGCKDSAYAIIDIEDVILFYVPNTFTPDFDEFNQTFQPVFTSGFDPLDFNMLIFNRYGEVVFESNDASVGWDGTYGASSTQLVKDGTYVWKIEFKETMSDKRHVHTGHINILK